MKKVLIVLFLLSLLISSSSQINISNATTGQIQISEIMPDPSGDDSLYEWLELQNESTIQKELSDLKINGLKLPKYVLAPNEIIILAKSTTSILSRYPAITNKLLTFSLSLSNSGNTLTLTDNTEKPIQNFQYASAQEDKSFELLSGGCNTIQISNSNSIGKTNSLCFQTPTQSITPSPTSIAFSNYSNLISINKINPCSTNESIELINNDSFEINLSQWQIEDKSGNTQALIDTIIYPNQALSIFVNNISLNDTGDIITLIDPSGNQKDIFIYTKCNEKGQIFSINIERNTPIITQPFTYTVVETKLEQIDDTNIYLKYPKLYLN